MAVSVVSDFFQELRKIVTNITLAVRKFQYEH